MAFGFLGVRGQSTRYLGLKKEQQVPPLRYAPVGMTILLEEPLPVIQMNCHPDRSVAKWRDLLFLLNGTDRYLAAASTGSTETKRPVLPRSLKFTRPAISA
jgi:hypothetical protein